MSAKLKYILAVSLFGTIAVFVKYINMPSAEIAFYRAAIALITLVIVKLIIYKRLSIKGVKKYLPILLFSGMLIGLNWVLLFESYNYTTVSVATLCYYFAPIIVMVASPIIFKESITGKQVLCFVMATAGIVLIIVGGDTSEGGTSLLGVALGLGAAVVYACIMLTNKYVKNVSGLDKTIIQFIGTTIFLLPYVLLTSGITIGESKPLELGAIITLGVLHTGLGFYWFFSALSSLKGQVVAILSYIDPFISIVLSVLVLGETMTALQIAGGVLVLGFTLMNEIKPKSKLTVEAKDAI